MDERQNSIERQCSMNRASDLCCAGKIELTALESTADRIKTWIQSGQPVQTYQPGGSPAPAIDTGSSEGGPPATEKQKSFIISLLAKCTWDEGKKASVRAGLQTMTVGDAKSIITELKG